MRIRAAAGQRALNGSRANGMGVVAPASREAAPSIPVGGRPSLKREVGQRDDGVAVDQHIAALFQCASASECERGGSVVSHQPACHIAPSGLAEAENRLCAPVISEAGTARGHRDDRGIGDQFGKAPYRSTNGPGRRNRFQISTHVHRTGAQFFRMYPREGRLAHQPGAALSVHAPIHQWTRNRRPRTILRWRCLAVEQIVCPQ